MEITNRVVFQILAERTTRNRTGRARSLGRRSPFGGASAAGPKKRPFPWVGAGAPAYREDPASRSPSSASPTEALRSGESLGFAVTLAAIALAALV